MNPNDLFARLRDWWQAQGSKRKISIVVAIAVVLVALAFLIQIIIRPAYAQLFSQLDPAEAGSIVEELEAMNVSYRLTNGGTTIEVPEGDVHQTRIKLASSGVLVGSGQGFELFDEQRFGITDFEQQVGYQRALQEEIRRTIVQLNEVEQARVHIVLPERSIFAEEQTNPSASIALNLKPVAQLEPSQVQGIMDIVTGAVEGLEPQNIHIVDMHGNVLNDNLRAQGEGNLSYQSATRQQLKRDFETQLEDRIQRMLSRILGPNSAVAMVTAELDFDQRQSTNTIYGPGQTLSEQQLQEEGTGGTAQGPGGTDGEFGFPGLDGDNQDTFNRDEQTTNYQLDTYQEMTVESPGKVQRLSIALVINDSALGDVENQEEYEQSLSQIQELIASAVGYDVNRGDQINVSGMSFDTGLQDLFPEDTPPAAETWLTEIDPLLAGGIAAGLLLLLLLFILWRRRRKARREQQELEELLDEPLLEEPQPIVPREPDQRDRIKDLAQEKPDEVAEVIKLWLKE